MSTPGRFTIDVSEEFQRLPKAPIVEAVIDIRAQARTPWVQAPVRARLEQKLLDYRYKDAQHYAKQTFKFAPEKPLEVQQSEHGFKGVRFHSAQLPHIAAFNRDGFVFSRLEPYDSWEQFKGEAIRLWTVYQELAQVTEIDRVGLRYINRIPWASDTIQLEDYIEPHPEPPRGLDLPYMGYLQRDTLEVPGYPYALTIIRTIQPFQNESEKRGAMILDIDAGTLPTISISLDPQELSLRLAELRWLKNRAFFGSIADKAMTQMKGGTT